MTAKHVHYIAFESYRTPDGHVFVGMRAGLVNARLEDFERWHQWSALGRFFPYRVARTFYDAEYDRYAVELALDPTWSGGEE